MYKERIIPILQILNRRLVKTVRFVPKHYLGDPLNAIRIFNLKGVSELIITDINATQNKNIDFDFLERIAAQAFVPIAYGGGISSIEDVHKLYQIGYDKVIVGSALYNNPRLIGEIVKVYGSQNLIASLDYLKLNGAVVPKYYGSTMDAPDNRIESILKKCIDSGIGEIFLHDIQRDGTYQGFDLDIIIQMTKLSTVPVIIGGGANSIENMRIALSAGASAAAAGSLFSFYGKHKAVLINYGGIS